MSRVSFVDASNEERPIDEPNELSGDEIAEILIDEPNELFDFELDECLINELEFCDDIAKEPIDEPHEFSDDEIEFIYVFKEFFGDEIVFIFDELNDLSGVYFAKMPIDEPKELFGDEIAKGPIGEINIDEPNELNKDKKKRKREELEKDEKKRDKKELENCHALAKCTKGMQSCCCAVDVFEAFRIILPPNEYKSWSKRLDPSRRDALLRELRAKTSPDSSIKDVEFFKSYLGDESNSRKANHQYCQQQREKGRGRVGKAIVYYLLALVICEYEDQRLDHAGADGDERFDEVDNETVEMLRWVYRILSYMKRLLPIKGNRATYELVACVASGTGKFHQRSGSPDHQAFMLTHFRMIIDKLKGSGDKMEDVCRSSLSDDNAEPSSKKQRNG
jgi:hypothetical protein